MVLASAFSLVMLGLGGASGLINMSYVLNSTIHNTQWVTGHFHLIYAGAIVIMYFAIAYELWPRITGAIARSRAGAATLAAIFLDALGGRAAVSELQLVQVRKAAELTTAAEAVRARVLAGDAAMDLELLVKIEGEQGARFERSTSRPPPSAARPSLKW
jgi:hypothetical protein